MDLPLSKRDVEDLVTILRYAADAYGRDCRDSISTSLAQLQASARRATELAGIIETSRRGILMEAGGGDMVARMGELLARLSLARDALRRATRRAEAAKRGHDETEIEKASADLEAAIVEYQQAGAALEAEVTTRKH